MKILKWLARIVLGLIALSLLAFVILGLALPNERNYVNEVEINAPADRVWAIILDKERYAEWQPNISKVERISETEWREYLKDSPQPLDFKVVKDERPRTMEFAMTMGEAYKGYWRGEILPTGNGVKLQTEDKMMLEGWLAKTMIPLFFDLDGFAKDWNSRLKTRAESK